YSHSSGCIAHFLLELLPGSTCLAKTAGEHDCKLRACLCKLSYRLRCALRPQQYDSGIRSLGKICNGWIALQAGDRVDPGADRVDAPGKAMLEKIVDWTPTRLIGICRGSDNGDTPGIEQKV